MSSTANLGIIKPVSEQDAQKVVTYNIAVDNLDRAVAGNLSLSVAGSSDVTLTNQASGTPGTQALNQTYTFTGVLTGNINVKFPATGGSARQFVVFNNTTGAFTLTVKTTAGGSTGIAVTQGKKRLLWTDGTNVYDSITEGGGSITGAASDLSNLTGPTAINTGLILGTDDGGALGSASKKWSDLFLASGGAVDFNNGDVTVTHSSNKITVAGGTLAVPDDAYDATGWNGSTDVPTKNAIRDKIESLTGAALDLSNLAGPTAINTGLIPGTDNTLAVGSSTKKWTDIFLPDGSLIGGWISYTPTFTNVTVGNGTLTAAYKKVGKLVFVRIVLMFGSTSSISGDIQFTLPVNKSTYGGASGAPLGPGKCSDVSLAATYPAQVISIVADPTSARLRVFDTSTAYAFLAQCSSTIPFTWTTSDEIAVELFYEAA